MAKDKDKGKETKPFSEAKDVVKIQDDTVKAKEAEAKDVLAFQPSKKEDCIRFLVRQSLWFTLIAKHPVIRRRGVHQAIPSLLLSHRRYHPYLLDCC